jgi:uncharacterized damage-inducible protein DinB
MQKLILNLLIIVMSSNQINAQKDVISAFLKKWENSKNYLIELAETMPEEKFNYKPTERQMSFQEQLVHIRGNMVWLSESYFADTTQTKSKKIDPQSKAELINEISTAFENVLKIISNTSLNDLSDEVKFGGGVKSKLQILNLLQDHVTHHRGQLIVYLNLNGLEPPRYTGW